MGDETWEDSERGLRLPTHRRPLGYVFQEASLFPHLSVRKNLLFGAPKVKPGDRPEIDFDEVVDLLGVRHLLDRAPHNLSGGERQRVGIGRALLTQPKVVLMDEPLSALDVSIQAQIINLLTDLKKQTKISFLFISHDLRVVQYFSDAVGVMYLGKIVEYAGTDGLFGKPFHPYTEVLLASAPKIRPEGWKKIRSAPLQGEVPSPINIPPGCPFHPRCPRRFGPCDRIVPELKESHGRLVSCHLWNPY